LKRALITGTTGQDGSYLAKFLLGKGYKVYGTYRRLSTPNFWRLQHLGIFEKINLIPADLADMSSIVEAIRMAQPEEIYLPLLAVPVATDAFKACSAVVKGMGHNPQLCLG